MHIEVKHFCSLRRKACCGLYFAYSFQYILHKDRVLGFAANQKLQISHYIIEVLHPADEIGFDILLVNGNGKATLELIDNQHAFHVLFSKWKSHGKDGLLYLGYHDLIITHSLDGRLEEPYELRNLCFVSCIEILQHSLQVINEVSFIILPLAEVQWSLQHFLQLLQHPNVQMFIKTTVKFTKSIFIQQILKDWTRICFHGVECPHQINQFFLSGPEKSFEEGAVERSEVVPADDVVNPFVVDLARRDCLLKSLIDIYIGLKGSALVPCPSHLRPQGFQSALQCLNCRQLFSQQLLDSTAAFELVRADFVVAGGEDIQFGLGAFEVRTCNKSQIVR